MVVELGVCLLVLKLNLVCDDAASDAVGGPADCLGRISRGPFGADIGVDFDSVRSAIVGHGGQCQIGEGEGLQSQILGL